jgi:hypothetical protein
MFKGAVIFTAGITTGVVGTPVALILIPGLRRPFSKGLAKIFTHAVETNPEFRASVIKNSQEAIDLLERLRKSETEAGFEDIVENNNLKDEQ